MNSWIFITITLVMLCICIILMKKYGDKKKLNIEEQNKSQVGPKKIQEMDKTKYDSVMSYNIQDTENIMKTIKSKTIEEISIYADKICQYNVQNIEFLKAHFADPEKMYKSLEEQLISNSNNHLLNPTCIGNSAYIAIHSIEPYKAYSKKSFDILMNYVK